MNQVTNKPIIGIIGGIGSGKSTVTQAFVDLGCTAIDADKIAHNLLNDPVILSKIAAVCGPDILRPSGQIDRTKLGHIAFSDETKLDQLNQILHPPVLEQIKQSLAHFQRSSDILAIVIDMPLLIEVDWANHCDHIIFVECPANLRWQHVKGKLSRPQWEKREKSQISLDTKKQLADTTICNNSGFSALVKQVAKIFTKVVNQES